MSVVDETPRAVEVPCIPCRGLGGFSRDETAFDCCDRCRGTGRRTSYTCRVELLTAIPCGEHVMRVVARFDEPRETWGCLNGHRFDARLVAGAWQWSRVQDQVAA